MTELWTILHRELVYIWYYFDLQLRQIFWYWVIGMAIGSLISVFAKDRIHGLFAGLKDKKLGLLGIIPACLLGIVSPLCMYGTIPIAASFRRQGMREDCDLPMTYIGSMFSNAFPILEHAKSLAN